MDYPPCGERQYSITSLLHGASGFFQVLPIALTLATFMGRRHPVAIAETPRRQAPYHAHVWECTMRMSGSVPCAWSRGCHAHVWGRTMRMVKRLPCACHGEFWLVHGIRDAGFDVSYSLYRQMSAHSDMPKPQSPRPRNQNLPHGARRFSGLTCKVNVRQGGRIQGDMSVCAKVTCLLRSMYLGA